MGILKKIEKLKKGFTLIEVVVSVAVFIFLSLIVAQIYFLIVNEVISYREQTTVSELADQYLEVVRNLPYSQIGTLSGNPHGNLVDMPNALNIDINGINYQVYYVINYVDDSADGTIVTGTDLAPNDYKQVKLYIKNTRNNVTNSFLANISPKGLEGLVSGGAFYLKVFDAVGQPIPGATVRIQNSIISPNIDLTRTSDASGNLIEVGLPNSGNSYHITVTKSGYSTDQTYPVTLQNPNPVKPDATISNGQVTQISFSIDRLSNLTFNMSNQVCSAIEGIGLGIKGSKLIGTPDILKFNNNYTSDYLGKISLNNIEWDSYVPGIIGSTYMIYGTSPIEQAIILPNTNQSFRLIVGTKTTNSLLVTVKDASNFNPIEGALVNLQKNSPSSSVDKFTSGSIWSQQDWSLGAGQIDFVDDKKYFSDDGNVSDSQIPSGLRLTYFNGAYVNSGVLTSSTFDTGTDATTYTSLQWQPTSQDPSTSIKFQIATNNDNIAWNYLGPDGTENSYYTVPGTTINPIHNQSRYIRYKAFLLTQDNSKTPVLTSLNINYVSGCFTPGQAMFAGLSSGPDYQLTVSLNGYQTQTISDINIDGYGLLEILLSH